MNSSLNTWTCHVDTCPFETRSANCRPAGCFRQLVQVQYGANIWATHPDNLMIDWSRR